MLEQMRIEASYKDYGHPLYRLNDSFRRLQEEHAMLEEGLGEVYRMARAIGQKNVVNRAGALHYLHILAAAFQADLQAHVKWQEEKMFPIAAWYLDEELDQFVQMEQEYEIAQQFLNAFLDETREMTEPVGCDEARELASYLIEAHTILTQRFRKEDELIDALIDRSNEYGY